ncbi:hypothetical protein FPRO05_06152 [Fusarium proliferatum]|uniref:Uncharacterized protein n=1 Tax=Gibberella intermedia TaxID=948311 RepID=A0A365MNX1_GIBIN|nr:hypothetical protein FPRO05_06152 [Fusarium proliferatum]
MDAHAPPSIRSFVEEHLNIEEVAVIEAQFSSAIRPDRQVLWTGMNQDAAQAWADRNGLQTLATAIGPLMNNNDPACSKKKSHNQWVQYVHGASALFALRISKGNLVTVLAPPPPERFHPLGVTSFQEIEEPIVKGQLALATTQQHENSTEGLGGLIVGPAGLASDPRLFWVIFVGEEEVQETGPIPVTKALLDGLRAEASTVKRSLEFCSGVDAHLESQISNIENHAEGDDTIQFIVSTNGKPVNGKNHGLGKRIKQAGGHFGEGTFQQLSEDFKTISIHQSGNKDLEESKLSRADEPSEAEPPFDNRHGRGYTLAKHSSKTSL